MRAGVVVGVAMITLFVGATAALSQGATGGGWELKPEKYAGQLGVYAVDDMGKGAGGFDDPKAFPAGTHFLIRFDLPLNVPGLYAGNAGLEPSPATCDRLVAEIEKNRSSLMGYRFPLKVKPNWKPGAFPAALKAHLLRTRTAEYPQAVQVPSTNPSSLCFKSMSQAGTFAGKATKVEAWVAYQY